VVAGALGAMTAVAAQADAAVPIRPTASLDQGTLTVTGSSARDVVDIAISHTRLAVDFGFDGTVDAQFRMSRVARLRVALGGGSDGVDVIGNGVGDVPITIRGNAGSDGAGVVGTEDALLAHAAPVTMIGGDGNDTLLASVPGSAPVSIDGGAGDDEVTGGDGSIGPETVSLGDGNDSFVTTLDVFASPFRGRRDVLDGGAGKDALELRGTFESEDVNLFADTGRLIVVHDGRDRIAADNVEDVTWFGLGGNDEAGVGDTVAVHDLSGTDVVNVAPDFSSPFDTRSANNSSDTLTVFGTPNDDHVAVSNLGADVTVSGLTPSVTPEFLDGDDLLQIDTLDGNDTVDSSGLQAGSVQLQVL